MAKNTNHTDPAVEAAVRIAILGFLAYTCYQIVSPFIELVVWGAVLAVAVYPIYLKLVPRVGGREGWTATAMVIVTLLLLIVPVYELTVSFIDTMQGLNERFKAGTLTVPPPDASVEDWPVIGERLYAAWHDASENLEAMVTEYRDELSQLSQQAVGIVAGLGGAIGSFILSTIIAGAFLAFAKECYSFNIRVLDRLADQRGAHFTDLCIATIRSVAQGVIGVALIQATASAIGLAIMEVPAYGVWVMAVLVLAVVQLPPLLILGPIAVYVFSVSETVPATIFLIYAILVSSSDAFLKPLFLGRGMDIPMPIILFGAIGGVILMGILGLFVGAIVLAIGYTLFQDWLGQNEQQPNEATEVESHDSN
ncbi:MAG: AI-2E family transporter [Pseudomonadales bacterium]|nr:AI-2E family transporter [Pseudomonadales bacterium]MBO6563536.1 AI-2E family transporter [Pseudomonadales bacterium]MBO6596850.1 AI-2E family transporter [Pseudomonadales bacterium]MBO6703521.1 AI-2E family transporter [Pseudomonadales bacterium]MBO6823161.1 AI-2E family transporter [Pseudomonadales bacterium]